MYIPLYELNAFNCGMNLWRLFFFVTPELIMFLIAGEIPSFNECKKLTLFYCHENKFTGTLIWLDVYPVIHPGFLERLLLWLYSTANQFIMISCLFLQGSFQVSLNASYLKTSSAGKTSLQVLYFLWGVCPVIQISCFRNSFIGCQSKLGTDFMFGCRAASKFFWMQSAH